MWNSAQGRVTVQSSALVLRKGDVWLTWSLSGISDITGKIKQFLCFRQICIVIGDWCHLDPAAPYILNDAMLAAHSIGKLNLPAARQLLQQALMNGFAEATNIENVVDIASTWRVAIICPESADQLESFVSTLFAESSAAWIDVVYCGHATVDGLLVLPDGDYDCAGLRDTLSSRSTLFANINRTFRLNCCYAMAATSRLLAEDAIALFEKSAFLAIRDDKEKWCHLKELVSRQQELTQRGIVLNDAVFKKLHRYSANSPWQLPMSVNGEADNGDNNLVSEFNLPLRLLGVQVPKPPLAKPKLWLVLSSRLHAQANRLCLHILSFINRTAC